MTKITVTSKLCVSLIAYRQPKETGQVLANKVVKSNLKKWPGSFAMVYENEQKMAT